MIANAELTLAFAWEVLNTVLDPEVPVLSICDLGMVRDVQMQGERGLDVVLTPTYSGLSLIHISEPTRPY